MRAAEPQPQRHPSHPAPQRCCRHGQGSARRVQARRSPGWGAGLTVITRVLAGWRDGGGEGRGHQPREAGSPQDLGEAGRTLPGRLWRHRPAHTLIWGLWCPGYKRINFHPVCGLLLQRQQEVNATTESTESVTLQQSAINPFMILNAHFPSSSQRHPSPRFCTRLTSASSSAPPNPTGMLRIGLLVLLPA